MRSPAPPRHIKSADKYLYLPHASSSGNQAMIREIPDLLIAGIYRPAGQA
jgi:hypothetical protein